MVNEIDIEDWGRQHAEAPIPAAARYRVRLWDGDGFDEKRVIGTATPTGRKLLDLFDRAPANDYVIVWFQRGGQLVEVGLDTEIDLRAYGAERLFAFRTDRVFKLSLNDRRMPWGEAIITVSMMRIVGRIPSSLDLVLEQKNMPDRILTADDSIDLSEPGLERVYTRPKSWRLNVQGVRVVSDTSEIVVSDALVKAGFDPNDGWIAILKVAGEPRKTVSLTDTIDLSNPGIEKLRLRPNEINNGEIQSGPRCEFDILEKDEAYLNERHPRWETIIEGKRRWLILRSFLLPLGYNYSVTDIAIDIPGKYPSAGIDMFFCHPHLMLATGAKPVKTDAEIDAEGKKYQQWSRHLNGSTRWNPTTDSVISHIALIDECLAREVQVS